MTALYDSIGLNYLDLRRPDPRIAAYLDPRIRSGSSAFWAIADVDEGLTRLARDLASGEWQRRYAELVTADAYDSGYRLVVANGQS